MEEQTSYSDRLPEVIDYLRQNPMKTREVDGVHYHIHMPPAPPPPPPAPPSMAEKLVPWLYLSLAACIIGTICAFILAVVMVALLLGLIGAAIVAIAISFAIKTARESQINVRLADRASPSGKRTR
jgi:hypothetical protein